MEVPTSSDITTLHTLHRVWHFLLHPQPLVPATDTTTAAPILLSQDNEAFRLRSPLWKEPPHPMVYPTTPLYSPLSSAHNQAVSHLDYKHTYPLHPLPPSLPVSLLLGPTLCEQGRASWSFWTSMTGYSHYRCVRVKYLAYLFDQVRGY